MVVGLSRTHDQSSQAVRQPGSPAGLSRVNGVRRIVVLKHETSTLRQRDNFISIDLTFGVKKKKKLYGTVTGSHGRSCRIRHEQLPEAPPWRRNHDDVMSGWQ